MKKFALILSVFLLCAVLLAGCGAKTGTGGPATPADEKIVLSGNTATYSGKGVAINGNVITITSEGEYHMTGKLDNGQVIIDTSSQAEGGKVILYLEDAELCCENAPAIYVLQAKSLHLVLGDGTSNSIISGTEAGAAAYDENANGGAIFAEDDIDIEGLGSLKIAGYINNGITCKDDVEINSGNISIVAVNNGIKGSESVSLHGGTLAITAGNDGIKATSASKEGKGYVLVDGCDATVSCHGDGVSAETELTVSAGSLTVSTDGDPIEGSCKALKGKTGVIVSGGSITATSRDHAIHSAAGISVTGGSITATSTEGKAIAAHEEISISDGILTLNADGDGIETKTVVSISGGEFYIVSGNDGIHVGEKSDGVNDATGSASISGGKLIIDAADDPIDAKAGMAINGGTFLGTGTAKKPKVFSSGSAQAFIAEMFSGFTGDTVSVSDLDISLTPSHDFTVVIISAPGFKAGTEYTVSAGDASSAFTARKE